MNFEEKFKQLDLSIGLGLNNRPVSKYVDNETGKTLVFKRLMLRHEQVEGIPLTGPSHSHRLSTLQEEPIDVGVPATTIRQVSLYLVMKHKNVASLNYIGANPGDHFVRLGFEYNGVDLRKFHHDNPVRASHPKLIKRLVYQLLSGIAYYHSIKAVHGNINPKNVLITYSDDDNDDENVNLQITNLDMYISPSYQAPELFLGSTELSTAVDMFSAGCIFAEMLILKPLFEIKDELASIFKLLGTPTKETMPGVTELDEKLKKYKKHSRKDLSKRFLDLEPDGVDLLSKLLCLNPKERITASEALKHGYLDGMASAFVNP